MGEQMKKLIGIHGKKGSGKDSTAQFMATYLRAEMCGTKRVPWTIAHYACSLKMGAAVLLNIPVEKFYDPYSKEQPVAPYGMTPREIMTGFNDVLIPMFGDQLFVNPVKRDYYRWAAEHEKGVFIIADVRFDPRETQWIREAGGIILHIVRDETDLVAGDHESEKGLMIQEGDRVIHNNDTLYDLNMKVWAWMDDLFGIQK